MPKSVRKETKYKKEKQDHYCVNYNAYNCVNAYNAFNQTGSEWSSIDFLNLFFISYCINFLIRKTNLFSLNL